MYILHIDSTTKLCSIAISKDGVQVALKEVDSEKLAHSEKLHQFIVDCLNLAKIDVKSISAVAVSKGPGSYTGLRIGVSTAKGLAFGLDIPIISVDTLEAMALAVTPTVPVDSVCIPMIDARRVEVFGAVFRNGKCLEDVQSYILDDGGFTKYEHEEVYFFGDGAAKCKEVLSSKFNFIPAIKTSATHLIKIAHQKFLDKNFEDTAYFEPFYLKDFVAGKPKKML